MIKQSILLALALACALSSLSQISFTGSGTAINTPINAPAVIIDNTLTIVNASSINGATVSLSTNFSAGDVLGYTGALPAGITATYNTTSGILTFTGTLTSTGYQTLLRRVTFRTSSSSTLQRTALFNLGELSVYPVNGHLYELVPAGVSWPDAKADAAGRTYFGLQGYLATITSQSENDFIQGKLSANGWIGASDDYLQINAATGMTTFASQAEAEGNWYWVSGPEAGTQFSINNDPPSQLTYMNWNPGEPNNFIDAEHYGEFYGTGDNAGMWNDGLEGATQDYVIEYGGMAGDPAIDITHSRFIQMKAT
ncbi:MAG TPA: hypothetical protein VEY06_01275, partial [Flavisolibacter sp.]|nr:hypothetical protein [Flavisolibacter sp.]